MSINPLDESWSWRSWVASANVEGNGFPLQSLPFCAFSTSVAGEVHLGVGIGDQILDLRLCSEMLPAVTPSMVEACRAGTLNAMMGCSPEQRMSLRNGLMQMLREGATPQVIDRVRACLVPVSGVIFHKPVAVGDYSDFYASIHHALTVGRMFRPDDPLTPAYKYLPIGYHGRASSIVLSGTTIKRPHGQRKLPSEVAPTYGPSRRLDFELEVAAYICGGNRLGERIPIAEADEHLFGFSLLNDWSARDVQAWEYQPLGPFLGKSFATSVSPWVVPSEALSPFRVPLAPRAAGDPLPMAYLQPADEGTATIGMKLEAHLLSPAMRRRGETPAKLTGTNLRDLYWSFGQMVTHHSSNGCNLIPGDLLGSGTVSGPHPGEQGCLLEITSAGSVPFVLPGGETRTYLEDGDEIILSGFCERSGFPRISLGECRGVIASAGV